MVGGYAREEVLTASMESINFCGALGKDEHGDMDKQLKYQGLSITPETATNWHPPLFDALLIPFPHISSPNTSRGVLV